MDNHSWNSFTVRHPKSDVIFMSFAIIFLGLIVIDMLSFDKYRWTGIMCGLYEAVFIFVMVFFQIPFRIQVSGTAFSVRKRLGKTFSFDCTEICAIVCEIGGGTRYGPQFFINIFTKENEVSVEAHMDGFMQMASYLLTQLNTGTIPENAASASCRTELKRYANGEIFSKKKRKG